MPLPTKPPSSISVQKILILSMCCVFSVSALSRHVKFSQISHRNENKKVTILCSSTHEKSFEPEDSQFRNARRHFLHTTAMNFFLIGAAVPSVSAVDTFNPPGTKYISGKSPVLPGEAKKKTDNPRGTRKDPDFLRSIADCRNQCQSAPGAGGLAKSKEDCLSECQDICCKTYEQCTFNIVPRI